MKRRDLLTAAVAAPVLAAGPAVAEGITMMVTPSQETQLMALFREWKDALAEERGLDAMYRETPLDEIEAQADAAADRRYAIELEMIRIQSQCPTDILAKIAAWTDFGVFQFDESDERLAPTWAEVRALVGEV